MPWMLPVLLLLAVGCHPVLGGSDTEMQPHADVPPSELEGQSRPADLHPILGPRLAAISAAIDDVRRQLQTDSGTAAADTSFIRLRRMLDSRIRHAITGFEDADFQANVWPSGSAAMARWREEQRADRRPTPEEEARAATLLSILQGHGIHAQREEGDTRFSLDEGVLLERVGPFLTPGMVRFLAMRAEDQQRPTAADGALMIGLDELGRRIRREEIFLDEYPDSSVRDVVATSYAWHLAIYLGGLPNTPAFHWRTGEVEPRWRDSWIAYAAEHGGSASGVQVARHLELLAANGFVRTAEVADVLRARWADVGPARFP